MHQKSDEEVTCEKKFYYISMILDNLSSVRRYATHEMIRDMNVAEHSYRVAILSMLIAEYLPNINMEKLLKRALMHDFEEAISGDILYTVKNKNSNTKKIFKKIEEDTISEMFNDFPAEQRDNWRNNIRLAKEDLEGKIISISDMLEILLYLMREIRLGNNKFDFFKKVMAYTWELINSDERFNFMHSWLNELYNDVQLHVRRRNI